MVEAINHDGPSSVATVGGKAVKYGLIGGAIALAVPLLLAGGAVAAIAGAAGAFGAVSTGGMIGLGLTGVFAGIAAFMSSGYASIAAVGSGVLGALRGSNQVSQENSAFRTRVMDNMNGRANKQAKTFNDGEVKGLQEGYTVGRQDGEQVGFQKGQEFVVHQIQQHMQAEAAGAHAQPGSKPDVKLGNKVISASCECKAESIIKEREAQAANPNQLV